MLNNSSFAYKSSFPEYNNIFSAIPDEYKTKWSAQEYNKIVSPILEAYEVIWLAEEFNNQVESKITLPYSEPDLEALLAKHTYGINTQFISDIVIYDNITVKEQAVSSIKRIFEKSDNDIISGKKQQLQDQLSQLNQLLFS